jgi:endonuclease/exonuclease/phosphatase family metal-dependent hydrolase
LSASGRFTRRSALGGVTALLAACVARSSRSPHAVDVPPATRAELRCVTWNIRHGQGTDGRIDLERTAATLAGLAPDIVLLQEVDRGCRRSGGVDQAAVLGEQLGLDSVFVAHRPFDGGEYGLALLARPRVIDSRAVPLLAAPRPLVALEAELDLGLAEPLTVVVVHLVDTLEQRAAEAREVAARIALVRGPWLVGGDFNGPRGTEPLEAFRAGVVATPVEARDTYPAEAPVREIDFLVAGPAEDVEWASAWVPAEALASDHRPVVARLVLRRADAEPRV